MGRFMRWLKQLLTGRKEGRKGLEESYVAGNRNDGPEKEKRRWSFVRQRKSGVDGGGPSSGRQAAVAAAGGESSPRCEEVEDARGRREEKAAVLIQKTFRGYLARKALRALRSLVKIQALVRGFLVRKQTAIAFRRLQTLVRLQADSIAVKKEDSYRKSMEEEARISEQEIRLKPPSTPVHRRRLSDSTDSNYERSPRIVEMDTCHLRSRSSRMAGRYTPDQSTEYRPAAALAPSCSPLPGKLQPARLSFRRCGHDYERDSRSSKTAHNTPRFAPAQQPYDSPAKSVVEYGLTTTPRRTPHRDALASPRYMAGTASSEARTRCHSVPKQRAGSRRPCPQRHGGCSDLSVDDEVARDYYLDSLW